MFHPKWIQLRPFGEEHFAEDLLIAKVGNRTWAETTLNTIYTLGYEGSALSDFIWTLQKAEVSLLLDIRELPQSRRAGFSKRALSEALGKAGISYRHVKQLGDPKPGREAARRGDMDEFRAIFEAHLDLQASQAVLKDVAQEAKNETVVLMCFERVPEQCHRALVAKRLVNLASLKVAHLWVQSQRSVGKEKIHAAAEKFSRAR